MAVSTPARFSGLRYLMTRQIPENKRFTFYLNTCLHPRFEGDMDSGRWLFDEWQLDDLYFAKDPRHKDLMLLRNRGGSKTRDCSILAVWFGFQRNRNGSFNRVIWYAASEDQLSQVKEYFMRNRYVSHVTGSAVHLKNGHKIWIKIASLKQAESARSDVLFMDEEQHMDKIIYGLILGTGVGGGRKTIHIGTTVLDSQLHINFEKLDPLGMVREHHVDELSWTTEEEELKRYEGMPQFVIDSQLYCKWVQAGGSVFTNLEVRYPSAEERIRMYPEVYLGCDPNPKSGHAMVGVRYIYPDIIYLEQEFMAETDSFSFARLIKTLIRDERVTLEIEAQAGYEFVKILDKELKNTEYDGSYYIRFWTDEEKRNRVYYIRTFRLIINPGCRETLRHIRSAKWKEKDPTAKIEKRPDQHYLDAFIHACCKEGTGTLTLL